MTGPLLTCLPASGIARNLFAAGISAPKSFSTGPAVLTHIFPPQGQIFPGKARRAAGVRSGAFATDGALSGSGDTAVLQFCLSVQPRRPTGGSLPHAGDRGDATPNPRRRRAPFRHLDRCSAKHAGQYLAESLGSVAPSIIGFAHGSNHEGSHVREVVKVCREFGNVCRA